MESLVPNGTPAIAMVRPGVGVVPLAVPPPDHFPQQMEQLQYAVSLNLPRYLPCEVSMVSSELSVVVVEVVVFAAVLLVVVVVVVLLFDFFCVADAACCAAFCCAAFCAAASSAAFFSAASFAAAGTDRRGFYMG